MQSSLYVAILMTLEGEYYFNVFLRAFRAASRNPHDIGRRILLKPLQERALPSTVAILMTLEGEYYTICPPNIAGFIVAILMTLEGEYY